MIIIHIMRVLGDTYAVGRVPECVGPLPRVTQRLAGIGGANHHLTPPLNPHVHAPIPVGCRATYCCNLCEVPADQLADATPQCPPRTEKSVLETVLQIQQLQLLGNKREARELSKAASIHPVEPGIFGFPRQADGLSNSMNALSYEGLHVDDLGIIKYHSDFAYLKAFFEARGHQRRSLKLLRELNQRLDIIAKYIRCVL